MLLFVSFAASLALSNYLNFSPIRRQYDPYSASIGNARLDDTLASASDACRQLDIFDGCLLPVRYALAGSPRYSTD